MKRVAVGATIVAGCSLLIPSETIGVAVWDVAVTVLVISLLTLLVLRWRAGSG
jgi:hypothetical protein